MENKLYRDENRKVIGGVCAGLAEYFNIDTAIMRVIFVFATLFLGTSFWLYIILWIVIPAKYTFNPGVDYTMPPPPVGMPSPVKSPSSAAIIFGILLILFGSVFLLNEYDLLPNWELHKLWPLALVGLGLAVIFGAGKRKPIPGQFESWNKEQAPTNDTTETL